MGRPRRTSASSAGRCPVSRQTRATALCSIAPIDYAWPSSYSEAARYLGTGPGSNSLRPAKRLLYHLFWPSQTRIITVNLPHRDIAPSKHACPARAQNLGAGLCGSKLALLIPTDAILIGVYHTRRQLAAWIEQPEP